MRILKKSYEKHISCPKCNAKLLYCSEDIHLVGDMEGDWDYCVTCPECGKNIKIMKDMNEKDMSEEKIKTINYKKTYEASFDRAKELWGIYKGERHIIEFIFPEVCYLKDKENKLKDMNEKEQTNTMRYIDKLICDVEKVLIGLGYKVSIEFNDRTKLWCIELLNANSSEDMPIRHKSMIRGLVKGYLHSFEYSCGTQKIYIYDECKGLHPEDDRYSTLEYAMFRVSDCHQNDLFVNYGTHTERYVIDNNEKMLKR